MRLTENLTSPNTGSPSNPRWDFQMVTFISQRVFLSLQQSSPWCNGEKLRRAHPLEQPLSLSPRLNGVQSAIRGWISVRKGCQSSARVNDIHAVVAGLPQGALWEGHLFFRWGIPVYILDLFWCCIQPASTEAGANMTAMPGLNCVRHLLIDSLKARD